MRKIKFIIPLLILFLTIGFAAVNFSLSINGDTELTGNLDNFNVYFSRALVNGETNNNIVSSSTRLDFSGILDKVGTSYIITYDVTNASTVFDADVTVKCTPSSEYLLVQNTFNVSSNLSALETRSGTLELKKLKTISNDSSIYKSITCDIVATPVERESEVIGTVADPLNPVLIGREVSIGTEKFNVISSDADSVTMLARHNISDSTYRQTEEEIGILFAESTGWQYSPGPIELEIQTWSPSISSAIDGYVSYLQTSLADSQITGNLITLKELENLGCRISDDYSYSGNETCANSEHKEWLLTEYSWWTRSALSDRQYIWQVLEDGHLGGSVNYAIRGVRPTITIPLELYNRLIISTTTYQIGREVSIGEEKFNIISDNGLTVTMLAKYNISDTIYKQTEEPSMVIFSEENGWEYTPGPKEIDVQTWGGAAKTVLNNYVSYLNTTHNVDVTGDLITVLDLGKLGCTISSDYSTGDGVWTCASSLHNSWLVNGQGWHTRSAKSDCEECMWVVAETGGIWENCYYDPDYGVRPIITIDKETLRYIESLKTYEIGEVVSIEDENFNVISQTATTVTMLAQYNLGADFKQTTNEHYVEFSDVNGWEYKPGPKEIDIQTWSTNPKTYINGYVSYLERNTNDSNIKGDLISLKELSDLGCSIEDDYSYDGDETCNNSQYVSWLVNNQDWWTRSAFSEDPYIIFLLIHLGDLDGDFAGTSGVRPTITISKETLKYLASQKKYEVGQEVSIGEEKFNVISDNGTTISMLAQYNLGADYKQTSTETYTTFSNSNGWVYTPGPKEIDIQAYDGEALTYIKNYKNYLNTIIEDQNLKVDLITLKDLEQLGCKIKSDYSYTGSETCIGSTHSSWLINGQRWWTRSAVPDHSQRVWRVLKDGDFGYNVYPTAGVNGVRPVITIDKSAL